MPVSVGLFLYYADILWVSGVAHDGMYCHVRHVFAYEMKVVCGEDGRGLAVWHAWAAGQCRTTTVGGCTGSRQLAELGHASGELSEDSTAHLSSFAKDLIQSLKDCNCIQTQQSPLARASGGVSLTQSIGSAAQYLTGCFSPLQALLPPSLRAFSRDSLYLSMLWSIPHG